MTTRLLAGTLLLAVPLAAGGRHAAARDDVAGADADSRLPARLVQTGLYRAEDVRMVDERNRAFAPQYPLWSDGAVKRRWMFLPEGTRIDGSEPARWRFPVGTRFWKEFAFGGRRVETRLLWKTADAGWLAAAYVWNEAGTDALLAPEAGLPGVVEIAPGRRHGIPSRADCAACHGSERAPLGVNALQLSDDRDAQAIHGEPLMPGMVTYRALLDARLLISHGDMAAGREPRVAARHPQARAVLGYLAANCGTCHDGSAAITAQVPSLAYADIMRDGDAVARSLIGQPTRWQAPGMGNRPALLLDLHAPEASALLLRMASRRPSSQMPPLGTVVRDEQALEAIRGWLESVRAERAMRTTQ